MDFDSLATVIRKYVGIRELTHIIVNEFVKKIIILAPEKSSGHSRQKIEIIWNFIGKLEQDDDKQTIECIEKAERHSLSNVPPCGNEIISLWRSGQKPSSPFAYNMSNRYSRMID